MKVINLFSFLVASFLLALALSSESNADSLRTVVFSGDAAPDTAVHFSNFGTPVLNNSGQVAFFGRVDGLGVNLGNGQGIWSEGSGSLALAVRANNPAPGTDGTFLQLRGFVFSDTGKVAFRGFVIGRSKRARNEIWSEEDGSLTLIVRESDGAPGTNETFSALNDPVINASGQVAFSARLNGVGIGDGIWTKNSGSLASHILIGDAAPGTNAHFSTVSYVRLNALGQTAFTGKLTGTGIDNNNDYGIWSEGSGTLSLVAREGNVAPGTSVLFSGSFRMPFLNDVGQVVFGGKLTGLGVDNNNDQGIWSEGSGSLSLVAREGNIAPGTSENFAAFGLPVMNSSGQTVFSGRLAGRYVQGIWSADYGVWSESDGLLTLVAHGGHGGSVGDKAPGTRGTFPGLVPRT